MTAEEDAQAAYGIAGLLDADVWTWGQNGNRIAPGSWPELVPGMDYSDPAGPVPAA